MSNFIKKLKEIMFLWGTLSAIVGSSIFYLQEYHNLLIMHTIELGLVALTIVSSAVVWFSLSTKTQVTDDKVDNLKKQVTEELTSIQKDMIRSDVDRWYKDHKDDDVLSDDELKYLHYLKNKLEKHKVNSFSQSQVNKLLNKFDR